MKKLIALFAILVMAASVTLATPAQPQFSSSAMATVEVWKPALVSVTATPATQNILTTQTATVTFDATVDTYGWTNYTGAWSTDKDSDPKWVNTPKGLQLVCVYTPADDTDVTITATYTLTYSGF